MKTYAKDYPVSRDSWTPFDNHGHKEEAKNKQGQGVFNPFDLNTFSDDETESLKKRNEDSLPKLEIIQKNIRE